MPNSRTKTALGDNDLHNQTETLFALGASKDRMAQEPFQSLMNKYELAKKINELEAHKKNGTKPMDADEFLKRLREEEE